MPQFDLQLLSPLVFWSIVSFGILLLVLYKFALPPVLEVLDERSSRIKGDLEKGERLKSELENMKKDYAKRLSDAEAAANQKLQEAIKEAKSFRDDILQEAKQQGEEIRKKAAQDILHEKKKAMAEIRDQVVSLSVVTASKILRHALDETAARKIADDVIKDLGEMA